MRYKVITAESSDELEEIVNEHLEDGWALQGGVSVTVGMIMTQRCYTFAQAIVYVTLLDR